jgi:hypothetical protein
MGHFLHRINRRAFLGGIAGSAAALPFLRSFPVSAGGGALPKLLLIGAPQGPLVGPHGGTSAGVTYEGWRPAGADAEESLLPAALPDVLSPLDAHIDRLLFLEGVAGYRVENGGAHTAAASLLTGRLRVIPGTDANAYLAAGISVDHYIAQQIDSRVLTTAFRIAGYAPGESYWSYTGPEQPVTAIQNPVEAYSQVFGDGLAAAEALRQLERRTSVLDTVAGDLSTMRARVPAVDRERLDAHLEAVFDLEQDLLDTASAQCTAPGQPVSYDALDHASFPAVIRDHTEILVQALACGWTRVASLQMGSFGGEMRPQWPEYGIDSQTYNCHAIAHAFAGVDGAGSDGLAQSIAVPQALQIERTFSARVAHILDRLTQTLDVDGRPLIESTLVAYIRPAGTNHNVDNTLWIIAGGSGVGVSGGRYLRVGDGDDNPRYYNDVLVSLCHAMGLSDEQFGDPQFCDVPVSFA